MPLIIPLTIPPEAVAQNQWKQLIALIQAEMNVGPTGIDSGTNTLGRLRALYYCHSSIDMWTGMFPAAAVQLIEAPETPVATHQHEIASKFWIRLAAASTQKTAAITTPPPMPGVPVPANLDDAMAQLGPLIADGAGNGMSAVLRDRANFNLKNPSFPNGLAYQTNITNWKFAWQLDAGNNAQTVIAYATCMYTAKARINI